MYHTQIKNPHYERILNIVKKHSITKEELLNGSIRTIYNRIITCNSSLKTNSKNIHDQILSNHMKTLNYKIMKNLTQVNTHFHFFAPTITMVARSVKSTQNLIGTCCAMPCCKTCMEICA